MTTEEKIKVIEARIDATNVQDWDAWEALHTEDCIRTAPDLDEPIKGAKAMREAMEAQSIPFPDYRLELVHAFGEGDWLCVEFNAYGTFEGPLTIGSGITVPPSHEDIESPLVGVFEFEEDKIASVHEYYDLMSVVGQMMGIGEMEAPDFIGAPMKAGLRWRVVASIVAVTAWPIFACLWAGFAGRSYDLVQNLVVILVSLIAVVGLLGAMWAAYALQS